MCGTKILYLYSSFLMQMSSERLESSEMIILHWTVLVLQNYLGNMGVFEEQWVWELNVIN